MIQAENKCEYILIFIFFSTLILYSKNFFPNNFIHNCFVVSQDRSPDLTSINRASFE